MGAALVVSVGGGWALSQAGGDSPQADDEVSYSVPVVEQYPSIGTNAQVEGDPLPELTLVDNDGNDVELRSLIGTPMIINYWYSSCAPCAKELPAFAAVHADLGDQIRFVGVNPSDDPEHNLAFAADHGVHYELLRDPAGAYMGGIGVTSVPMTIFVSADGTIVRQTGVLDEDTLREYAGELLA
jgi:peroxiredoxin